MSSWNTRSRSVLMLAAGSLLGGAPALLAQESGAPAVITLSGQARVRGEWDGRTSRTGDDAVVLS